MRSLKVNGKVRHVHLEPGMQRLWVLRDMFDRRDPSFGCIRRRMPRIPAADRRRGLAAIAVAVISASMTPAHAVDALVPYAIAGDGIAAPLTATPGDAARGRRLVIARDAANCVLCHAVPDAGVGFAGDVGPSLAGVGARLAPAQLRLAVVDNARRVPQAVMPGYYRVDGLVDVAPAWRGKPILAAQDVEDLVTYLATLR